MSIEYLFICLSVSVSVSVYLFQEKPDRCVGPTARGKSILSRVLVRKMFAQFFFQKERKY